VDELFVDELTSKRVDELFVDELTSKQGVRKEGFRELETLEPCIR
jgi:hypothetical protein